LLREVMVKNRLERINIQKKVIVETLLDSRVIELMMSLEFTKKQRFKLKKTYLCEKYRWFFQQEGTYWAYSGDRYVLLEA